MKYTETELEKTLNELAKAKYAGQVDVVDQVMERLKEAENKEKFSIKRERRVHWTIGTMSLAAASVALLLFIGNSSSSQAQNENDGMAKGAVAALDEAGITHGVDGKVVVMGFDCNKWALRNVFAGDWNYDGQCSPFQAGVIDEMIKTLEAGGAIEGLNDLNQIISVEKGFDAMHICRADIDTYGLGE